MIYYRISLFVAAAFFLASLFLTIRGKRVALLLLFVLGIGFSGLNVYWGTLWFPYKIVALFILTITVYEFRLSVDYRFFNIFVLLFIASLFFAIILQPPYEISNVPLFQQSHMRPFIQLLSYLSIASIIPFTLKTLRNEHSMQDFFTGYCLITEIVMIIAFMQFLLLKSGLDFMPILRPNIIDSPCAVFSMGDILIRRLYGVTGEPKTLAAFLFPYFFVSLYNLYNKNYNRRRLYHIVMLLLSLFVIINAFSSAVLISLSIGLFLSSLIWFRRKFKAIFALTILIAALHFLNPLKVAIVSGGETTSLSLFDVIFARTYTRLSIEKENTFEYRALSYLVKHQPFLLFTGLGMGMYPYHITGGGKYGINPIDSNWIAFLMDFGIIGIAIFIYVFYKMFKLRRKMPFRREKYFNCGLMGLFAAYLLGLGVGSYVYMILFLSLSLSAKKIILFNQKYGSHGSLKK